MIKRHGALKCATRLCEGKPANVADVLALAEKLVKWLSATPRRNVQEDARANNEMEKIEPAEFSGRCPCGATEVSISFDGEGRPHVRGDCECLAGLRVVGIRAGGDSDA